MDEFGQAWVAWIIAFLVIEGKALMNAKDGDTLSEKVWAWFDIDKRESNWTGKRIMLVGFLTWLLLHLGWRIV